MPVAGAIAEAAKGNMPLTWDALGKDPRYGDPFLQRKLDTVKNALFGAVLAPELEETTYDPTVVDYAGKLVAIQVAPGAADYWASQPTEDSSGERKSAVWVDRAEATWELQARLIAEARAMEPDVDAILGTVRRVVRNKPPLRVSDNNNASLVTTSPFDIGREFAEGTTEVG